MRYEEELVIPSSYRCERHRKDEREDAPSGESVFTRSVKSHMISDDDSDGGMERKRDGLIVWLPPARTIHEYCTIDFLEEQKVITDYTHVIVSVVRLTPIRSYRFQLRNQNPMCMVAVNHNVLAVQRCIQLSLS